MSGQGFVGRGWLLSGRLLLRVLLVLVMLGLGLSVSGVLLFPCQPLLLRSLSVFFDCGRVVRCVLPFGCGRFLHLVVLYGYQGADREAEKLALTDQHLHAAFGELGVVARGQPCMLVGDFFVEPIKIPCLSKGISLKLLGLLLLVGILGLPSNARGTLLVGSEETSWWAALVLLLRFLSA